MEYRVFTKYQISTVPFKEYRGYGFSGETKQSILEQVESFINFRTGRGQAPRSEYFKDCKDAIEKSQHIQVIQINDYANEYEDGEYGKRGYEFDKQDLVEFIERERETLTKSLKQLETLESILKTME